MNNSERKKASVIKLSNKLNEVYGNKYTFNILSYIASNKPVKGYCTEHKCELEFTANSIYRGTVPCKICKGTVDDTESFIRKASEIHGDTYSYVNSLYVSYHNKVVITCKNHGNFKQRVSDHLSGKGCTKCANNIPDTSEVIKRFIEIHGTFYDYSKVAYTKMHDKVEIVCPIHGPYFQKPADHIFNLQGCPSCGSTCFSSQKPGTFYVLKVHNKGSTYYKIGITNKTLKQRYSSLHDRAIIKQCFVYTFTNGALAQELEAKLLAYFSYCKLGFSILLSGNTEIVTEDIRKTKYFKELFNEQRAKDHSCGN